MPPMQREPDKFDQAIATIPSCALDEEGLGDQRARYSRLATSVTVLKREAEAVVIEFRENFDRQTLEQLLEVERACCPFFRFEFDESTRRLCVTVREADKLQALDAIAHALAVGCPA